MNDVKATHKCYKCGMCMFQCPVYSVHRNEVYSSKGKINAIDLVTNTTKIGLYELSDVFRECNLCGHCTTICPGEIETPELVVKYRSQLNKIKPFTNYEQILNNIKQSGNPYAAIKSGENNSKIREYKNGKEKILLFLGCTARHRLPEKIISSVLIFLDKLGLDYTLADDEPCCGNILYNLGYTEEAHTIAKKNRAFVNKFNQVITLCPGCYNMFKSYKKPLGSSFEVFHILEIIQMARAMLKSNIQEQVFFQVPCHIYNSDKKFKKIIPEIIPLFEQVSSSLDVTQVPKCCGAGGGMLLYNKEYVKNRINILIGNESAENVLTACPFCYLNFEKHTSKNISFITEKLEVTGETKIELKENSKIYRSGQNGENKTNVPVALIKYKISSNLEKLLPFNK